MKLRTRKHIPELNIENNTSIISTIWDIIFKFTIALWLLQILLLIWVIIFYNFILFLSIIFGCLIVCLYKCFQTPDNKVREILAKIPNFTKASLPSIQRIHIENTQMYNHYNYYPQSYIKNNSRFIND